MSTSLVLKALTSLVVHHPVLPSSLTIPSLVHTHSLNSRFLNIQVPQKKSDFAPLFFSLHSFLGWLPELLWHQTAVLHKRFQFSAFTADASSCFHSHGSHRFLDISSFFTASFLCVLIPTPTVISTDLFFLLDITCFPGTWIKTATVTSISFFLCRPLSLSHEIPQAWSLSPSPGNSSYFSSLNSNYLLPEPCTHLSSLPWLQPLCSQSTWHSAASHLLWYSLIRSFLCLKTCSKTACTSSLPVE